MPYRYLEDIATADAAFEARGKDLAELFLAASDALMNVMVSDLASIGKSVELEFGVEHEELDLLLFNFLQEIVFFKDARRLLLRVDSVEISSGNAGYALKARASGEELDPEKHDLIVDVKAVTLYRFELRQTEDGWLANVVLDI
ncbi:MAG TPA: archease [Geobacteraceae bacterium]|nr:archease [Geobacteraceae bacterium]